MSPLISDTVIASLLLVICGLLIWIRLRERHWLIQIEAINQSWNNSYKAPAEGFRHTRHHSDRRTFPMSVLSLGQRSGHGRDVA